jgi:hypothetical protein
MFWHAPILQHSSRFQYHTCLALVVLLTARHLDEPQGSEELV